MLMSPEYKALLKQMHALEPEFGTGGARNLHLVRPLASWGRTRLLDWGCGKGQLKEALGPAYQVTEFDPCVEGKDTPPDPHPVVFCGDVLEHVEPECLSDVLRDLRRVTQKRGLWLIATVAAKRTLPDGRNTHLIQKPKEWWLEKAKEHGFIVVSEGDGHGPDGSVMGCVIEVMPT